MRQVEFDHLILTRFNVRITYENMDPNVHPGIDETWLKNRFELYERVCLPSVAKQTIQSFRWLVFMDENTPVYYKNRMAELARKHTFLTPLYCKDGAEKTLVENINSVAKPSCKRIMTRLDNDDAIHPEMVENIQKAASANLGSYAESNGFFIAFPIGYTESMGDYYLQRFRYNPFISFVADASISKSIFYWRHTKISEYAPVVFSYKAPMWCQVIHDENVVNSVRGLYWPWGKNSGLVAQKQVMPSRSFQWQCKEFWRTFKSYLLRR